MKPLILLSAVAALSLGGCETDNKVVRGAAIGAAGGAVAGAIIPGLSTVEGAAIGAAGGATLVTLVGSGRCSIASPSPLFFHNAMATPAPCGASGAEIRETDHTRRRPRESAE